MLVDWNQDGLLDVLLGDATQLYQVFLNEGIATAPRLGPGRLGCWGVHRPRNGASHANEKCATGRWTLFGLLDISFGVWYS